MTDTAKRAEPRGYGILKIPADQRRYGELVLAGDTINTIVTYKVAHPLASHTFIAEALGLSATAVHGALNTIWGKTQVARLAPRMELYASRLEQTQGSSVELWGTLVDKANSTIQTPDPNPTLVNAGLKATELVGKATGLLSADTLTIKHELASMGDHDPDDLALDPSLGAVLDDEPTSEPEGEPPPTPE